MYNKWYWIALTAAIIMAGLWSMEKLYFDRMDQLQKNSQQVIER